MLQKLLNCLRQYCFNNIKLDTTDSVSMHIVFTFLFVTNYELQQLIFNNVLNTRVKSMLTQLTLARMCSWQWMSGSNYTAHAPTWRRDKWRAWSLKPNGGSDDTRVSATSFSHGTSNFSFVVVTFYINGTFRRCCDWFIKRKSGLCQPCCFEVPGELGSCPPLLDWPAINSWEYDH